jgi:hypothetical protein
MQKSELEQLRTEMQEHDRDRSGNGQIWRERAFDLLWRAVLSLVRSIGRERKRKSA